ARQWQTPRRPSSSRATPPFPRRTPRLSERHNSSRTSSPSGRRSSATPTSRSPEHDDLSRSVVPTEAKRSGGTSFQQLAASRREKAPPLRLATLGFGRDDEILRYFLTGPGRSRPTPVRCPNEA